MIDKMQAGRELDDLIEEKIFGKNRLRARQIGGNQVEWYFGYPLGHDIARQFSTEDRWTMILLDKLRSEGLVFINANSKEFVVFSDTVFAEAETFPLALCRFALLDKEQQEEDAELTSQ